MYFLHSRSVDDPIDHSVILYGTSKTNMNERYIEHVHKNEIVEANIQKKLKIAMKGILAIKYNK